MLRCTSVNHWSDLITPHLQLTTFVLITVTEVETLPHCHRGDRTSCSRMEVWVVSASLRPLTDVVVALDYIGPDAK